MFLIALNENCTLNETQWSICDKKKKQNDYTNHIDKLETIIINQEKALAELKKEVLQNKIYTNVFPDKHDAIQGRNINDEDTKGENNNTSGVPYIRSTNSRCYLQQSVLNRSKIFFFTFYRFYIAYVIALRIYWKKILWIISYLS